MGNNTRVKICGLTRKQDVEDAVRAGADAIGLVFYPPSPRAVTVEQARELAACVPAFVTVVGLFVNPDSTQVRETLDQVPLDLLQFHGDETPEFCAGFGRRWIKAVRVRSGDDIPRAFEQYRGGSGILADAWSADRFGGTGLRFNWDLIPDSRPMPLILAGGLASDNVAGAIESVGPWAVDVSGGVESSKGIKDFSRMTDFISEVHRVDTTD